MRFLVALLVITVIVVMVLAVGVMLAIDRVL
jgi:hypothetical protein